VFSQNHCQPQDTPKVEPMVEGYAGFLFLDKNDMPMVALHWEKYLEHIIQKYNRIYRIQMPKVTPHALRHTFCSRCFEKGITPKVVQQLMGHAHYSTTIDIYTHISEEMMGNELEKFKVAMNA